jgi:proteasome lid subunit RPN8/RPN11
MITLRTAQLAEIFTHARQATPFECCGLIGGAHDLVTSIHPLRNVAGNPQTAYEAAPEDLFAAQKQMRERGEELLAIYHSHPRATEPVPSETDVRLAYYPAAIYLIIGLGGAKPIMKGFRISERDKTWQQVEYAVADE